MLSRRVVRSKSTESENGRLPLVLGSFNERIARVFKGIGRLLENPLDPGTGALEGE